MARGVGLEKMCEAGHRKSGRSKKIFEREGFFIRTPFLGIDLHTGNGTANDGAPQI